MARDVTPPMDKRAVRKMRAIVFPRDNWTCQDCGIQILPESDIEREFRCAPFRDGRTLELDHIVPRSFGGPSTAENLRAACTPCNRKKSASLVRAGWRMVFSEAIRILAESEPGPDAARRAIAVLKDVR